MNRMAKPILYKRVREILGAARTSAARSVNSAQVAANWLIGREIIEEEQQGKAKAGYGEKLIQNLARKLQSDFGSGYDSSNLKMFRQFYHEYPDLLPSPIGDALRHFLPTEEISKKPRQKSRVTTPMRRVWKPGILNPNLSWTHYRILLRVDPRSARPFYEIEAVRNSWSARELERQKGSLLFERLSLSKDKKGLLRLASKGQEIRRPVDAFKDPVVMEFLNLPESPRLVESDLEQALISNLQAFLLELGRGFAFVSRQERITLDGDHFYIDLVFYHTVLKCYVLIDLKAGKLTHQDLGQLQLYVNYFDRERATESDNPTLGLILCTDKNDAVVRYTLGPDHAGKIFASRYKLHLPSEKELTIELRRELKELKKS